MDEVFPVLAGVVLGLLLHGIASRSRRGAIAGMASVAVGALASWVSGELAVSWLYVLIDTAQVLVAALLTSVLVRAWRRRTWRAS
jgi:hypothetical protein